jgi:hypothetical protein
MHAELKVEEIWILSFYFTSAVDSICVLS